MVNRQLKSVVDQMCEAIETLGEQGGLDSGAGQAARYELGSFMMYLSASDGQISWEEAEIISDICELNLTPNTMGNFIRQQNIYSTEFENKVPVTFQMMVTADNALIEQGEEAAASEAMLDTYRVVGKALIQSDGDVDDNEVSDYRIYINMLEKYRDQNMNGAGGGASGFTKTGGASVSAPSKSGVAAPRKG